MTFFTNPLNLVTLFPLVGVLLLLFMKQKQKKGHTLDGLDRIFDHLWYIDLGPVPV